MRAILLNGQYMVFIYVAERFVSFIYQSFVTQFDIFSSVTKFFWAVMLIYEGTRIIIFMSHSQMHLMYTKGIDLNEREMGSLIDRLIHKTACTKLLLDIFS